MLKVVGLFLAVLIVAGPSVAQNQQTGYLLWVSSTRDSTRPDAIVLFEGSNAQGRCNLAAQALRGRGSISRSIYITCISF
jgi:hypothetical protein